MSRIKGKFVFGRFGAFLDEVCIKYQKTKEKFSVRLKIGKKGQEIMFREFRESGVSIRKDWVVFYVDRCVLYDFLEFSISGALDNVRDEAVVSEIELGYIRSSWGESVGLGCESIYVLLSLVQYMYVFNWAVCDKEMRRAKKEGWGGKGSRLELRKKGSGFFERKKSSRECVSGVRVSDYVEAKNNVLVALKYRDEAWFVEYVRIICLYEGKEFDLSKVLTYFRKGGKL